MNVQITDINETRKTLTVTLDKGEVDGEYNTILGEFTKQVSLPGFRPGKAPAAMVAKRFGKELKDEFKQKVIGKANVDLEEKCKEWELKVDSGCKLGFEGYERTE